MGLSQPCRCLFLFAHGILLPAPVVRTLTPSARKRRVACLTFSRHREGIAKRPCINMIRRHATWLPRSATSYLAYTNFGEVFSVARYAVAYVPGSFRDFPAPRIGAVATERDPPVVFRGSGLHGSIDPLPARWWILCAAFRRTIASRKAVPTDVKDQCASPSRT